MLDQSDHKAQIVNRTAKTQGVALVVTMLMALILIGILMTITGTLSVSSRRTTSDRSLTLRSQYAAESGLARARAQLSDLTLIFSQITIPVSESATNIKSALTNYCDGTSWTAVSGVPTCTSSPTGTGASKYSFFTTYASAATYPTGFTASTYWPDAFNTTLERAQTIRTEGSLTVRYRARYGLVVKEARETVAGGAYQLVFRIAPAIVTGEVLSGASVIASRKVQLDPPNRDFVITVLRPSFARYVLFRNQTTSTSGGQLYLTNGEVFNGPVHTNGTPGFAGSPGPSFTGGFTTAASGYNASSFPCSSVSDLIGGACASNFSGAPPQFSVPSVPLPTNNNNQLRAAFGGDAGDTSSVTAAQLQTAWGVPSISSGIYYSQGNGTTRNTGSAWLGGIYVSGNVDNMTFSTTGGQQVITIVQGATTTSFSKNADGTWTVRVNGSIVRTMAASPPFNGMIYVSGSVTSLGGDGSGTADIASDSQLTLSTTGDVVIKRDLTYTDNPTSNPAATNVLGIFSSGGSVLLDGPTSQSLNVHASIMATAPGEGFGTVSPTTSRGSSAAINLVGGVIEDQSQTVGSFSGSVTTGGYRRNYNYDPRFLTGFAPPYFPLQQRWNATADDITSVVGAWQPAR